MALVVVSGTEGFPPPRQFGVDFTGLAAQSQKVKAGPKARLLQHGIRRRAGALFKTRLHRPDFAHVDAQLAATRHVADLGIESVINRVVQRRHGVLTAGLAALPALAYICPQHARQQKARRNGLALADATVGILQRKVQKRIVDVFYHHVEQRVDTGTQSQCLELGDAGQRMTCLQQLEHFVEQARLRHIGQQRGHLPQRRSGFVLERET